MNNAAKSVARWLRERWFPILVGCAIGLVVGVSLGLVSCYVLTPDYPSSSMLKLCP